MKNFVKFIAVASLFAILAACEEEKGSKTGSSKDITATDMANKDMVFTADFKPAPSGGQPVADKPQHYIRSHGNFGVETLQLESNPYIAMEMIGWSKTGLLAYRYKYFVDDGRGQFWVYSYAIINASNNKIVEQDSIEAEINAQPEEIKQHKEQAKEYKEKWTAILEKYEIAGKIDNLLAENFKNDLSKFPVDGFYSWLDYSINSITIDNNVDDEGIKIDTVKWQLMVGNGTVQKAIGGNIEEFEGMLSNISGRKILGYYKSPYENIIVVALSNYYWFNFSGGYHTIRLELFGCGLKN
ncbi:MAG: hypothetical protein FWC15_03945 [Fibromonadales bacterium]|nr:hypothetical protein [Fibromonadales bacterium]